MENNSPISPPTQSTLIAGCLFVIATILLAVALSYTRSIMIPFVVALFLSYFVTPVVAFLEAKAKIPHWAAVMIGLLFFLSIIVGFGLILHGSIFKIIDSFYLYQEKLTHIAQVVADFALRFKIQLDQATLLSKVKDLPVFTVMQNVAGTAMTFLMDTALVSVFLIFLVSGEAQEKTNLGEEIDAKVRGYILTKIATSLLTAVLVWIVYVSFRLDLALMFGLLCFVFCFIPTLGSIIATLLPLPIALIQYEERLPIICIMLIPAFIQLLIGNILEPKLFGKGLDLHPITILLSLMFWGLIWGIAGMFLAVPITAVLKIILERIPFTRRLSQMLAGHSPV